MERMSAIDASFLYLEDGVSHMHIGSCAIFEGPPPSPAELKAMLATRLHLVPRYRQRARFVPFDLGQPVWVDDQHFNLDYHVRHLAVPTPGGESELQELVGRVMSTELDRARPLWEVWLVEGLEQDHWALISKVHHCMVDGVSGTDLLTLIFDLSRSPAATESPPPWSPEPEPTGLRLMSEAVTQSPRTVWPARGRSPAETAKAVTDIVSGIRSFARGAAPAPPSSLQGKIGRDRRWTWATSSLEDIKRVRRAFGGTVNDVVLTAIAGGFRDLLTSRGESPQKVVIRTLVPVNTRDPSQPMTRDNQVSGMLAQLPIDIEGPADRLTAMRARMDAAKSSHQREAASVLSDMVKAVPPPLFAAGCRTVARLLRDGPSTSVNTVTTNVPGPQFPLYAMGRELLLYLPYVPIAHGVRVGVAITSYNGRVSFGITGDYDTASDIGVLAAGIETTIEELVKAADNAEPADQEVR